MKLSNLAKQLLPLCAIALLAMPITGCNKKKEKNWKNSSALKYNKNGKPLWEDETNPRMIQTGSEFKGPSDDEFVALLDEDLHKTFIDGATRQPRFTPGEAGSPLPSLASYQTPSANSVFKAIHFDTDQHVIQGASERALLENIASYLKKNQNIYLYVEGHCDQRGTEGYNQALGTRRSNSVREFLISQGIDSERVHTISYGKEKPITFSEDSEALRKNRRAEFKIYQLD